MLKCLVGRLVNYSRMMRAGRVERMDEAAYKGLKPAI